MTDLPELPDSARGDLEEAVKCMERLFLHDQIKIHQQLRDVCAGSEHSPIYDFALLGFQVAAAEVERRRREGK